MNKSSRGTHFQTATSENCAAIYRLRETSYLPSSAGGMALTHNAHSARNQPDNFDEIFQALVQLAKYLKKKC